MLGVLGLLHSGHAYFYVTFNFCLGVGTTKGNDTYYDDSRSISVIDAGIAGNAGKHQSSRISTGDLLSELGHKQQ